MKRAISLIAATVVTASVYSQEYSGNSSPDSTPPDYQSRQSEAGAPASEKSSSSSTTGYETSPGASGGNSLTGQSSGANLGSAADQDQTLTTRDSDLSSGEYRGTVEGESDASGSSGASVSGSENSEELRGTGTADGAFHEPASPVREGAKSEGWSASGTFSGAGPGAVTGSATSTEVSGQAALEERDTDLTERGLVPDSNELSRSESFSNSVEGDQDQVLIFEDWTIVEPDTNFGGPAGSDSGSGSSSEPQNSAHSSIGVSSSSNDSYSHEFHQRVQRDWSSRLGNTDVPATGGILPMTPRVMDHEFDHLRVYNSETVDNKGAAAGAESGAKSSRDKEDCEVNKRSSAEFEQGEVSRQGNAAGAESQSSSSSEAAASAPGEYGDRATSSNYDDGHLTGNNAKGSSEPLENSTPSNESPSPSAEGALTQPDL